jgi:transposase
VEALSYIAMTGCQWRALPRGDKPARSTVQGYFYRWPRDGTWMAISHKLVELARSTLGWPRPERVSDFLCKRRCGSHS